MTGFGEALAENQSYRVAVTVRSVNHRFLDVVVRLGEEHRALESAVTERIRTALARGRVEVRVTIDSVAAQPVEVELREDLLRQLTARFEELGAEGVVEGPLKISDLVRLPQVLTVRETPPDWSEADEALVLDTLSEALRQVGEARVHEGNALEEVLLAKLEELASLEELLAARRSVVAGETLAALQARIGELLEGSAVSEERLAQEAVLLIERGDVQEELDRLRAHVEHFRTLAAADGPHGRRLEFVVQEVQRELNTLGSKCRDAEMGRAVVDGKLVCEQLREQLLNVE